MKFQPLFRAIFAAIVAVSAAAVHAAEAAPKPNIILIISDDQGFPDYGFMGHPVVKTPNLDRLKEKKDANGQRLFDNCIVSFGSAIRGQHQMKNLAPIISGGAAKRIKRGEYIILPQADTPLSNLWLTLLQEAGVKTDKFSKSTGPVPELLRSV